jgi:hypothetical protein
MTGSGIGRVLIASLHQGITDRLPSRLEFYENWLNPAGLRDGRIGLAQLTAVLSFLRAEGLSYHDVMAHAGGCAADWTFAELAPMRRAFLRSLPVGLRTRFALRLARQLVRESFHTSRATFRLRRSNATVDLRGSVFCGVRERADHALCGFYAAAIVRLLALVSIDAESRISECRGAGQEACLIDIAVLGAGAQPERIAA